MKNFFKNFLRSKGYKVSRLSHLNDKWFLIESLVRRHSVNVLIDVGANSGQFLQDSHKLLKHRFEKTLSFEPLALPFKELGETVKGLGIAESTVLFNIALGTENGSKKIHIAPNSVASSLLEPSIKVKKALNLEENSNFEITDILIQRFDDVARKIISPRPNVLNQKYLVKVDVQGYEKNVLDGFGSYLNNVQVAIVECSFVETYQGRPLFSDIIGYMEEKGFHVVGVFPGFYDQSNNQLFEVDVIFSRGGDLNV